NEKISEDQDPKDPPYSGGQAEENNGQLIVDATCAPQDIRFPNDVGLLSEAREKADAIIDTIVAASPEGTTRPRTYRKVARVVNTDLDFPLFTDFNFPLFGADFSLEANGSDLHSVLHAI
ncbi:MAG: hypothetical protein KBB32_05020, partial [Spirochaetia bacterium]|nr:hypothetical protein [Spirochaetia bacterium]